MTPDLVIELLQQALMLALVLAGPPLIAVLAVAIVVGVIQGLTGIQDPAIGQIPRFAVALIALMVSLPWIVSELQAFARILLVAIGDVQA